jgi:cell division protein FtsI/penicillin-binding protein 2
MFHLNRCGEEKMRVEETRQHRRDRAKRFQLYRGFIILLFAILLIRTYDLQITKGEKARLKSETYEDVVMKKSIFNDNYYSSKKATPLETDIKNSKDQ